ncbi:antibiotic biosynthesis monooxygenase [Herbiconiux sp. SYSU D00978]|uniref:antibiotic biosynthesis monooxygenase n=1 Tax=Herbiconiux sp. SYSU D00978 TaxID=2812562 RepID=UPI001A9600B4|nr:antibiotic biosynthesis monooxygenase [Herbiconiux sp. SYSU D00978]
MAQPITVSITRTVSPDRSKEVAAWARAGQDLLSATPGYLGSGWIRPDPASTEWHMLYRFADAASLEAWERSPERAWWIASAHGLVEDARAERRTGIEGWFDEPASVEVVAATPPAPPRWKQMVAIFLAFYPLSLLAQALLVPLVADQPLALRVLLVIVVVMPIMTYLALPGVTRALRPWLLGRPATTRGADAARRRAPRDIRPSE